MKTISKFLLIAALLIASNAMADTIYTLTADHCTGSCGTSPFGEVVLSGGSGTVNFKVTLFNGNKFVATGFPGAFGFNVDGLTLATADVSITTAGFTYGNPGAGQWDGFKDFQYAIICSACGNGGSNPQAGPLEFSITHAGLTVDSFHLKSTGTGGELAYFVADIISGSNGNTGPVGAVGEPTASQVPEPASLMLMGSGLGLLATRLRRK